MTLNLKKGKGLLRLMALAVSGILLILDSILAWNYVKNVNLGIVLPGMIGAVLLAMAVKPFVIKGPVIRKRWLRAAALCLVIALTVLFISVEALIIADPFLHRAEMAGRVDYLVVLGCGIWPDGRPTLALIYRLDRALEYYEENPHVKIVVSGGKGRDEPFPEADAMASYLMEAGVPESSIIKESRSTSTMENFKYSRNLIGNKPDDRMKIVFITNDFHVMRARILAKRNGFDAYAIPAPTPAIIILNSYLREFFAFMKSMTVDY